MCFYPFSIICAWLVLTCCCLIGIDRIEAEERYQRRLDAYHRMVEQPIYVTVEHRPKKKEDVKPTAEKERTPEMKMEGT